MKSTTILPSNGMQYLMAALAISAGIFFTNVTQAANPVPYQGPYTGPVGIGEPRDVMRLPGAVQRPVVAAPAAVVGAPADVVIISTVPHKTKVAAKPKAKSDLQVCKDDLARVTKGWDSARLKAQESSDNNIPVWLWLVIAAILAVLAFAMGRSSRPRPANPEPAAQPHQA